MYYPALQHQDLPMRRFCPLPSVVIIALAGVLL